MSSDVTILNTTFTFYIPRRHHSVKHPWKHHDAMEAEKGSFQATRSNFFFFEFFRRHNDTQEARNQQFMRNNVIKPS